VRLTLSLSLPMQAAVPAPSTPRQTSAAHARFASPIANTLGSDSDFKLRVSETRTPFTTPRGPPTPPDSGNKRPTVSFDFPSDRNVSQESPLAQKMSSDFASVPDNSGPQMTRAYSASSRP
jgi:hypothetical protein